MKVAIITKDADLISLSRYEQYFLVGIDEGIYFIQRMGFNVNLAVTNLQDENILAAIKNLPLNRVFRYKGDSNYMLDTINFVLKNGASSIDILGEIDNNFVDIQKMLHLLSTLNTPIFYRTHNSLFFYCGVGNHVIRKGDFGPFYLIGYPEAKVTLEHVNTPLKNKELKVNDYPQKNISSELLSVLKVHNGGVLVVQVKENE